MESRSRKRYGILLVCLILILAGCATIQLEDRVAKLEDQIVALEDAGLMEEAAAVGAASRMYGRTELIGGTKSVDNIASAGLVEGDMCIVTDGSNYRYDYRWDASNNNTTNPESSPNVIEADDGGSIGAWILAIRFYSQGFYSAAPDGEHLVDPSNTISLPPTPPDGAMSSRDDYGIFYLSDGTDWFPGCTNWYGEYTTTSDLPYDAHWCGTATNYGTSGLLQLNLKKALLGMEANFHIVAAYAIRVNPDNADKFIGSGFIDGEYYWADGVGEYITIKAVKNGAGATDVDWAIHNIGGIWAQQTP